MWDNLGPTSGCGDGHVSWNWAADDVWSYYAAGTASFKHKCTVSEYHTGYELATTMYYYAVGSVACTSSDTTGANAAACYPSVRNLATKNVCYLDGVAKKIVAHTADDILIALFTETTASCTTANGFSLIKNGDWVHTAAAASALYTIGGTSENRSPAPATI